MIIEIVDAEGTGKKIKALAIEKGYTVKTLAETMGTSEIAIYKWYKGISLPKIDNLIFLKAILNCSLEDLIETRKVDY